MSEKYRFRTSHTGPWVCGSAVDALQTLSLKTDKVEIRLVCLHTHTHVSDGVKYCQNCNEQLEVTSFRD